MYLAFLKRNLQISKLQCKFHRISANGKTWVKSRLALPAQSRARLYVPCDASPPMGSPIRPVICTIREFTFKSFVALRSVAWHFSLFTCSQPYDPSTEEAPQWGKQDPLGLFPLRTMAQEGRLKPLFTLFRDPQPSAHHMYQVWALGSDEHGTCLLFCPTLSTFFSKLPSDKTSSQLRHSCLQALLEEKHYYTGLQFSVQRTEFTHSLSVQRICAK